MQIATDKPFDIQLAGYDDLPGWNGANLRAATDAFAQTCERISSADPHSQFSRNGMYRSGTNAEWLTACVSIRNADPYDLDVLRQAWESSFAPYRVRTSENTSKLTGYFEPLLKVRSTKQPGFEAPIPKPPSDLVTVDTGRFNNGQGRRLVGKVSDGKLIPYETRAEIVAKTQNPIAWGDPVDVFYLQIQGSGRLLYPDGSVLRAAYAAHNGQPFKSVARHLIDTGEIELHQAGIEGIRAWMNQAGEVAAQEAMNVNPRFVWFRAEHIQDPGEGPKGAEGVPLTPMGSMAIDPAYHPYGAPIFINSTVAQQRGDWRGSDFTNLVIAQDTGGAIKGAIRGDLFFGWEGDAGGRAAATNHPLDMWVLLPRSIEPEVLTVP